MWKSTRYPTKRALQAGTIAALIAVTGLPGAAHSGEGLPPLLTATVSVDFHSQEGELARQERYNNFANAGAWSEQRSDDVAFLNEQGLHGDIYRVWLSDADAGAENNVFNQCSLATDTCDFSPEIDAYLTQASTVADSVLVNLNPRDFIEGERPLDRLEPLLELILHHLKDNYPAVSHVEVFNEPDWKFYGQQRRMGQEPILQPDELYRFYVPFYRAVNEVNKGVLKADRLQVGGPALMYLDPKWMEQFLDDFTTDHSPRKRLDFISYHAYLAWDDNYLVADLYKFDISRVASDREIVLGWLKERGLRRDIPSFVTETGIYPGPSFDDPDPKNDYIRQAAGLATYNYWYSDQPDTHMFNWVVRHYAEERKDQLVTRTPDGPITDTFTPYGNMMLMQSKMKDTRVSAVSDAPLLDGDNGIYAIASKDKTGASLMVWNWQHIHNNSYRATIDMSRLPSELRHGPVRQRMFRIDQTTSNYFTNPDTANLQQVDEKIVTPGKTHTETIDLTPNAIYLILLEPA